MAFCSLHNSPILNSIGLSIYFMNNGIMEVLIEQCQKNNYSDKTITCNWHKTQENWCKQVTIIVTISRAPAAEVRLWNPCNHFCMVIFFSGKWLAGTYEWWSRTRWRPSTKECSLILVDNHIGDPYYGQLTAVKIRNLLTSITWSYHGLNCRTHRGNAFLKLSADQEMGFPLDCRLKYFKNQQK